MGSTVANEALIERSTGRHSLSGEWPQRGDRAMTGNIQSFGNVPNFQCCNGNGFNKIVEGVAFQLAAGIMGQYFNALTTGAFAFPTMPSFCDVRCGQLPTGCPFPPCGPFSLPEPQARWTAQLTGKSTANVDLGDGYRLEVDDRSSQLTIINDKTGERTRIWGDPHVEIDGKQAYDFWGTTTFTLENGTKVTINTEQWGGNPNAYVASQVVVTKGQNAMIIDGISQNTVGDLSISMSNDGYAVDAAHRDGYTLHENECGSGWNTEAGTLATQQDLDATRVGREFGPGSELPSLGEISQFLGAFILFGALAGVGGSALAEAGERLNTAKAFLNAFSPTPAFARV
jgi:Domain of Unknown Function (DUF1521)